ncbi:MAG: CpaD family pilus assembly lipoprotein [Asticcacaulis sp.]
MTRPASHALTRTAGLRLSALAILAATSLTACATGGASSGLAQADPVLPTEQYPIQAQARSNTINLRINPQGLSDNQRRALDQIAAQANWVNGDPVDVDIITAGDPRAMDAGRMVSNYLSGHDVGRDNLNLISEQAQPADIISINITQYRTRIYDCNTSWENLTATRNNKPYKNFGCAVNSNLAAQIHDPRDLNGPRTATPSDAIRKGVIFDKYQKGEITSAAVDAAASGTISNAIK